MISTAEFSFIVIRGGAAIHTKQELMKFLYSVLVVLDANEKEQSEFDASYTTIPRVVVQHGAALRQIEAQIRVGERDANTVQLSKLMASGEMTPHQTGQKTIVDSKASTDPRYGIMDAHTINTGAGNVLALNIAINTMTDFSIKTYLNLGLARKLNVGKSHDVISVVTSDDRTKQIEFFESNSIQNRNFSRSVIGSKSGGALSEYKSITSIDVGSLIQSVDKNVNINDTPEKIEEIDQTLVKMRSSLEFMDRMGLDKPSVEAGKREMLEILKTRETYAKLSGETANMISIYFKLNKPDSVRNLIESPSKEKLLEVGSIKDVSDM